MSEKTAASIFIDNGTKGRALTPYKHSMSRLMLYIDIEDVCKAYRIYAGRVLEGEIGPDGSSLSHIFNVYYPEPVTILELAQMVRDAITKFSEGKIRPTIEIVDTGERIPLDEGEANCLVVDASRAIDLLGLRGFRSPRESIEGIVRARLMLGSRRTV
jgi:UDP-glucose 4-epimerase